jgi:hypothetical protein
MQGELLHDDIGIRVSQLPKDIGAEPGQLRKQGERVADQAGLPTQDMVERDRLYFDRIDDPPASGIEWCKKFDSPGAITLAIDHLKQMNKREGGGQGIPRGPEIYGEAQRQVRIKLVHYPTCPVTGFVISCWAPELPDTPSAAF